MFNAQEDKSQSGFMVAYREDSITVYRLGNVRRDTIDDWAHTFQDHKHTAQAENRHLRILMDIRRAGLPTPYAIGKAVEAIDDDPDDLRESTAILTNNSLTSQILSNALRHLSKWLTNTRLFTDEQAALDWLNERLEELGE